MPKFYGQNKKRIDPRYFLDEKCDNSARYTDKPWSRALAFWEKELTDEECRIATAINSWVARGATEHDTADIDILSCKGERDKNGKCMGDPYRIQVWKVFQKMLKWSKGDMQPALRKRYEEKFFEYSVKYVCEYPHSIPFKGVQDILEFFLGAKPERDVFRQICRFLHRRFPDPRPKSAPRGLTLKTKRRYE